MAVGDDNKDRTKSEEASASSDDGISRNGFPLTTIRIFVQWTMSRVLNILEKSGMKLVPPKSLQAVNSLLCTCSHCTWVKTVKRWRNYSS